MEETQSRHERRYDRKFKENAVALVESGKESKDVARDLGVSHWLLKSCCKRAKAGKGQTQFGTMDGESGSQLEIRRLRQEIDYLRRQREILKALGLTRLRLAPSGADLMAVCLATLGCIGRCARKRFAVMEAMKGENGPVRT